MSGNTIGGIAGGLIGFAIGGPAGAQWGWMIGSVVGGIVDPQTIQGAQWQNQQLQGSADGLARAIVFGTSTVTGNLLDAEPGGPRIGKVSEGGKGGPEVERDTAILTYAIEICDSSELRGTSVSGVIAVWEDEKLVYDVRPDPDGKINSSKIVNSQKWLANKRFYFGREDQSPPAELASIHGTGNIPAYRGSCIMTVLNEDLMVDIDDKPRGRIPTYRFLVSACAPVLPETPAWLVTGQRPENLPAVVRPVSNRGNWTGTTYHNFGLGNGSVARAVYRFNGKMYAHVYRPSFNTWAVMESQVDDLWTWVEGPSILDGDYQIRDLAATKDRVWIAADNRGLFLLTPDAAGFIQKTPSEIFGLDTNVYGVAAAGTDVLITAEYGGIWKSTNYGESFSKVADIFNPDRFYTFGGIETDGERYIVGGRNDFGPAAKYSDDGGQTWIACEFPAGSVTGLNMVNSIRWLGKRRWMISMSFGAAFTQAFFYSTDGGTTFSPVSLPVNIAAAIEGLNGAIAVDGKTMRVAITGYTSPATGGQIKHYYSDDLATWTEFANSDPAIGSAQIWELNPIVGDSTPIPDVPGYYVDGDGNVIGPDIEAGDACSAPLDYVVRALHKIGAPQLSDAEFDLTALAGEFVRGYTIQDAEVTVASACDPLRKVWSFDLPSYDGQIHAIKRGRAADWSLSEDDLVTMDSGYEESLQDESLAFPLKLHIGYTDPVIDYKETTQISERYSADARVAGEEKISMGQLVLTATEAKRAVVKAHKQAWANIEDTRKLAAPLEYIEAVNSDTFAFRGKRYRADSMRVEGLQVVIESAAYDRIGSYQSAAIGVEGTPGPSGPNFVRGPTISVLMNMPVLRDDDDKAGLYWAASGLLEGWSGASLQIARDGVTFTDTGVSVAASATMGTLVEAVGSASRYGMDEVNHIKVKLKPLSGGLESTDMTGLLREANGAALVYPDGTVEVIQFLTATETAEREYTLSGLLRGRMNTTPGAHAVGAWFVLLNDAVRFVPLRNDDSGTSPTFRAVSAGTVAETNLSSAVNIGVLQSLKEWEPTTVRAVTGAGEVAVTWAGRGRLGSSRMPVHSLNFKEYRATVDGVHTAVTTAQAATVPAPGITEPYTTTVAALSRIASQFDSAEGT